jgi:staphylococcal nuclease domain-containing protein 1
MMPTDSQSFISEWKGKPIDGNHFRSIRICHSHWSFIKALVEQVKDGSTLRVRLLLPDGDHQFVNITLAGVRCPRFANRPEETTEPYGEEVTQPFFIDSTTLLLTSL